jgi:hypothetical protein|tara:strand:- start:171 stop:401 length:231 start_codon:yes stop_codon:yes gene_type:complete
LLTKIASRDIRLDVEHLFFDPPKEHDAMFALHGDVRSVVVLIFSSGFAFFFFFFFFFSTGNLFVEVAQKEFNSSQN